MCESITFYAYWAVGIATMVTVWSLTMQKMQAKWPGHSGKNTRRLLSLPLAAVVYLLGASIWSLGSVQVTAAICPAAPPAIVTPQ